MKGHSIIDIIERSQSRHALQEERELKDLDASTQGTVALICETDGVRISKVAVPGSTKWSPPHDGRDRLVVLLGKTNQLLERDCDTAVPGRWAWVSANSNCNVVNASDQTRDLIIVEFDEARDDEISQIKK